MKSFNLKTIFFSTMIIGGMLFSSCEKENDDVYQTEENSVYTTNERNGTEQQQQETNTCMKTRSSCPDNLTNDGCEFTSGDGRDFDNQYLMVDMLNDCRTESLGSNCSWFGNYTQTEIFEVDLNNCCSPGNALNGRLDIWMNTAKSNRPNSTYIITDYERIGGYMVTTYGPYRMRIKVTYRKKICQAVATQQERM